MLIGSLVNSSGKPQHRSYEFSVLTEYLPWLMCNTFSDVVVGFAIPNPNSSRLAQMREKRGLPEKDHQLQAHNPLNTLSLKTTHNGEN